MVKGGKPVQNPMRTPITGISKFNSDGRTSNKTPVATPTPTTFTATDLFGVSSQEPTTKSITTEQNQPIAVEKDGMHYADLQITPAEVGLEIALWKNTIICKILGANLPLHAVEGFIKRIWGKHGVSNVSLLRWGFYLARFAEEGLLGAMQDPVIMFDGKLNPWYSKDGMVIKIHKILKYLKFRYGPSFWLCHINIGATLH